MYVANSLKQRLLNTSTTLLSPPLLLTVCKQHNNSSVTNLQQFCNGFENCGKLKWQDFPTPKKPSQKCCKYVTTIMLQSRALDTSVTTTCPRDIRS